MFSTSLLIFSLTPLVRTCCCLVSNYWGTFSNIFLLLISLLILLCSENILIFFSVNYSYLQPILLLNQINGLFSIFVYRNSWIREIFLLSVERITTDISLQFVICLLISHIVLVFYFFHAGFKNCF